MARGSLGDPDYRRLLTLRTELRRFLHWSEEQAQLAGLTPMHHQLLLAIRGHDHPRGPTISNVAGYLMLRHHSAVELVQRAGALDLLRRVQDPDDRRVVRLALTDKGAAALEQLSSLHIEELSHLANSLLPLWNEPDGSASGDGQPPPSPRDERPLLRRSRRDRRRRAGQSGTAAGRRQSPAIARTRMPGPTG